MLPRIEDGRMMRSRFVNRVGTIRGLKIENQ